MIGKHAYRARPCNPNYNKETNAAHCLSLLTFPSLGHGANMGAQKGPSRVLPHRVQRGHGDGAKRPAP